MDLYDDPQPLYLKTDASGITLVAALLETRSGTSCQRDKIPDNRILRPIVFASKSLSGTERRHSNIEREALHILHGLEMFHHYFFAREVSIITVNKMLVAMLSQQIQEIFLRIHQYRVRII